MTEDQPKTFGCNHAAETCPLCEVLVQQWKSKKIDELRTKLAEAEKDAAIIRTKAIAMERVTTIALNKLRNWPATYAMQPTNEQFIAMSMAELEKAMKEQLEREVKQNDRQRNR